MAKTNNKNQDHDTAGMIVKGAGVVAAGAAVVAAGVVLSDKDRREKLGEKAGQAMNFISDTFAEVREEAPQKVEQVKKELSNSTKKSSGTARTSSKGRQATAGA